MWRFKLLLRTSSRLSCVFPTRMAHSLLHFSATLLATHSFDGSEELELVDVRLVQTSVKLALLLKSRMYSLDADFYVDWNRLLLLLWPCVGV